MAQTAMAAAQQLAEQGIEVSVIDARFLKPLDSELLTAEAQQTGNLITLEENVLSGGFGSSVMELMEEHQLFPRIMRLGLPDKFIEQGTQQELLRIYQLDTESVVHRIKQFLGR